MIKAWEAQFLLKSNNENNHVQLLKYSFIKNFILELFV